MKLIDKDHINELKKLYNDIDNCISDLIVARGKRDDYGIAAAHWQMETLMVNTQQTISYIFENLEVKEVNLEKEDAIHGTVDYPLIGCDFPNIYPNYKEFKEYCDRKGIKDNDKVKLIIIKDM